MRLHAPLARALCAALLGLALLAPAVLAQDPRASVTGRVARDWLALVDKGDTKSAYAAAGEKFRAAMPQEAWAKALLQQRESRGKLAQRALGRSTFDLKIPNAPEGEYALLLFRTSFEKQADATESLTLEREKDGVWRVVGYVIK